MNHTRSAAGTKISKPLPFETRHHTRFAKSGPSLLPLLLVSLFLILLSGCSSYNDKVGVAREAWTLGAWEKAATTGLALAQDKEDHRNGILYGLEEGTLLRTVDRLEESQKTFEATHEMIEEDDQKADFRLSQAGISLLLNPALTTYRARTYDRIMLHTYSALNYLTLEQPDAARVALNRAYKAQQDAVAQNAKEIAKMQEEIENKQDDDTKEIDLDKIESNPVTRQKLADLYGPTRSMQAYGSYVNPFSVYLDGLFFLNCGVDSSDLERGLKSMERASSLSPGSPWLLSEYALAQNIINGKGQPDSVVVLLETGLSPIRVAEKIELPLFLFGFDDIPYFAASFPVLKFQPNYPESATATGDGKRFTTEVISDMDRVIAQEFNDHESLVVTQAILAAATKAATVFVARSMAKEGSSTQAIIDIFGIFYQAITNQPDLRTWFTLPKQIQGTRVPMPEDRNLTLEFAGSNQKIEVPLIDGKIVVVHVRVTATAVNPVIQQFSLQ